MRRSPVATSGTIFWAPTTQIAVVHPVVPPRVDYDLTPLGRTLLETVRSLLDWALDHIDDIDEARKAYDARS
ncbi:winged helix-turn-helix transcriptional regulator [Streptomyces sp. PSKA28]|uniref:Winged helix-turn-helix transcriptional regulator n=1 Tax=Streptomyces himalayensis subsp. himalayensis TaxID=2756131 RepID=A0A7W0DIT1_9ACTN|nr:winged helix-turn-helix transcriptional regulator [Streptomyces himalayensis subsp. himalayensis]